jgi:hypothetical protein
MKEENKIKLADMQRRLQARMHYDNPDYAFRTLIIGFAHFKKRSVGYAGQLLKRKAITPNLAHEIALYVGYPIDKS